MTFDWADYLELAKQLIEPDSLSGVSVECCQRCAASRAYYAALGRAAAYLKQVIGDDLPDDHTFHEIVISRFCHHGERSWRRVGEWLNELREYRKDADYYEDAANWLKNATASVIRSRDAIHALEEIFNGPPSPM